jgi:hypothetical protein
LSLRAKLNRLAPPAAAAPRLASTPAGVPPDRTDALAALRARMAEIMGRPEPERRPPADPTLTDLPFARVETDFGPICQRIEVLGASHHVGRMPVEAAASAAPELLALLALDPRLTEVAPSGALYLDTETTGLGGGAGTVAFLVGLAAFTDDGRLQIEQLLLRTPSEEAPMLRRVADRVEAASHLVTFNGKTFDLPLLEGRMVMNRLAELPRRPHLDLLHIARRLHRARIGSCSLKAVESAVLGFGRDGDIDGGEVAPRYGHFLRTGDETALSAVVEHNYWDVVSMAALVGLYGEPVGILHEEDLVGLARTLRRARALDRAQEVAEAAVVMGAGPEALRVRAQIAKARGDRARALSDFETLAADVDDSAARCELVKLYEHFVKAPDKALAVLERGTGESDDAVERRRARIERKVAKLGRDRR